MKSTPILKPRNFIFGSYIFSLQTISNFIGGSKNSCQISSQHSLITKKIDRDSCIIEEDKCVNHGE